MKVWIDETCNACGLCVEVCPDVFGRINGRIIALAETVPPELEESVQQTADECPIEAIEVE